MSTFPLTNGPRPSDIQNDPVWCRFGVWAAPSTTKTMSALPVPGDTQVTVLQDRVEVGDADVETLHERWALLQQPFTARDHLTGADAGILAQTLQGQTVDTLLQQSLLLLLQPGQVIHGGQQQQSWNNFDIKARDIKSSSHSLTYKILRWLRCLASAAWLWRKTCSLCGSHLVGIIKCPISWRLGFERSLWTTQAEGQERGRKWKDVFS